MGQGLAGREPSRAGGYDYDILHPEPGKVCKKPPKGYRFSEDSIRGLLERDLIVFGKTTPNRPNSVVSLIREFDPSSPPASSPTRPMSSRSSTSTPASRSPARTSPGASPRSS